MAKVTKKDPPPPPPTFKLIVAGGRGFDCFATLCMAVEKVLNKKFSYEGGIEIVSGTCKGADSLGESWYHLNKRRYNLHLKRFPAPWDDIEGKPANQIGTRVNGDKYWKGAGHFRNGLMADYSDALLAFWDGNSTGTEDMIIKAKKKGLDVITYNYADETMKRG